jgi:glycosyltransferase involved in cell wall biosynthesis
VTSDFEKKVMLNPEKNLDFTVLMLASLRPYKGIFNFLELAKRIPEAGFVMILSDESEEVMKFESENLIPVNLKILPIQKDVHPFYRAASLLLNLTQKDKIVETFGLTVLEGMYYGLPAIVPTVGGITELVDSGKNGFQIDYNQLEMIEKEIRKMMKDQIHYKNLSQEALQKKEGFSRKVFGTQILQLLGK